MEDTAFRIVELYAQRNSIWERMKKDRETVVEVKAPTRVENVGESARVPDAREDRTGLIAPPETATLERAGSGSVGSGSVAPFKTGSLDNVPDKAHLQNDRKGEEKGDEATMKPKTLKVGSSADTPKTKRAGPKRQEIDKVGSPAQP